MKAMKTLAVLLLSCALCAHAAPPAPPPPADRLGTLQDQQDKLGTQLQLLYNTLRDITQFQQYIQVRTAYEENQRQIDALKAAKPETKPEAAPVK